MGDYILPLVHDTAVLRDKSSQLLLDHGRHTVWLFPPKNAQTSLRAWVGDFNVVSSANFKGCRAALTHLNYRLIMSVRHPVDRLLSAHANKFDHIPLEQLATIAAKYTDLTLDIHLQAQTYMLHRLGRDRPDIALRVDHLVQDCRKLPWMLDEPDIRNTSHWSNEEYTALPENVRLAFEWRYRDDYALWALAQRQHGGQDVSQ